jgi:hypothetical protein
MPPLPPSPPPPPPLPSFLVSKLPSVIDVLPYMMPSAQLSEMFDSLLACPDHESCRTQFLQAALGSGAISVQDLVDATAALSEPAKVVFSVQANCSTFSPTLLTFSEPVLNVAGQPFSAADLSVTVDSVPIDDAVVTPLATPATYSLHINKDFSGYEKLVVSVPANRLVGARFGVVPAHTGSLALPDCISPGMQTAVVGSDQLPLESAPTGSDGQPVELNTLFLTFSEPVVGSTPDGVVGSDFMIEVSGPMLNTSFTVVPAETIALAYGGKNRRLQQATAVERVALKLLLSSNPLGGEVVRITPLSVRDEAGNTISPVAYAVLGALTSPLPDAPGAQAGIVPGNVFKCTTLEAGQLIIASFVLTHAMLYGAGVLLPYVARAEHVAKYGAGPPKQRFAPRWGPAAWAVTLILCVSLLPMVAFGHVAAMSYTIALFPLWVMLLALSVKRARALHRMEAPLRSKTRQVLPAALPLLHLALGVVVASIIDYPATFSTAGIRIAATLPIALGVAAVSIRLLLERGPSSSPKEAARREHVYRRALARQSVGLLLLVIVVILSAARLEWDQTCQQSWAWVLLPLLCAVGLLLIQQLLQRLLPRCFAPPAPLHASHATFRQELPAELEPKAGDAQLMLQKVMDRALAEGRSLTEVADEMLNQQEMHLAAPELPLTVLTAVEKEFEQRHGRAPADEAETLSFLKNVVQEAQRARVEQKELELITVPGEMLDQAHAVLLDSGVTITAGQTSDVRALQALSEKLALEIADFESRPAVDADASREALALKRSVNAYISAQTRVAELEAVAALPEVVTSALHAAFGDTDTIDCEKVLGADAVLPAAVVMAAEMEFERREGRDPTDEAEAISFLKGVVQGAQQARVEQKELELITLPDEAVEMVKAMLEVSGAARGEAGSSMRAFQALSDKLALDVSTFESYAAQADATRETLVLKRTVDTYLDAQKRVAELEKSALPAGIAFAIEAEFAQSTDGEGDHHDPLEVLDLCAHVVYEYAAGVKAMAEAADRSQRAFTTKMDASRLADVADFDLEFKTERMDLEYESAHGFDMMEENEDGTVERLSFRRSAGDDEPPAPSGGQRLSAVKQASEADKPRVPAAYRNARAAPVLKKGTSSVLKLKRRASGVMSDEAKAQVKAAVAHLEGASKAVDSLNEASAQAAATQAAGQRKSILVPVAALATGLAVTVTAGVLAGVLGSGTAAPSAGTAIALSLGAAVVIAVAVIAYRVKRHYRKKKVQMLSHQLRKTSRVSLGKEKPPARSGLRNLPVPPALEEKKSVAQPHSSSRNISVEVSVEEIHHSERSDSTSLQDLERLQARVNRVTESNQAPVEPPLPSSPTRLPPLTSRPSSIPASSSACTLDRAALPDTLAARLSAAKNGKTHAPPSPTPVGAFPDTTASVPQHRAPPTLGTIGQTNSMKHRIAPVAPTRPGAPKKLAPDKLPPLEHVPTRAPPTLEQAQPAAGAADPA